MSKGGGAVKPLATRISSGAARRVNAAFITGGYGGAMRYDPDVTAELVDSIHQPWRATVGECLRRWHALDGGRRSGSFLVVHGEGGGRQTLNAQGIAILATRMG